MATITSTMKQRADEQWETVKRLNALSNHHWTVDAGPLDVDETHGCANDTAHGLGTCYMPEVVRETEPNLPGISHRYGVCPNCMIQYLTQNLVEGDYVSPDVTR